MRLAYDDGSMSVRLEDIHVEIVIRTLLSRACTDTVVRSASVAVARCMTDCMRVV